MIDVLMGADNSQAILDELERNIGKVERESAERVADRIRSTVRRRTGATAASVEANGESGEGSVVVGGAIVFLEHGTVNMPAFPTMTPAFESERDRFEENLKGV